MAAKKETATVEASESVENTESCTGATDMVEIEIFKDSDRYKDDVVVALNGKGIRDQKRGPRQSTESSQRNSGSFSRAGSADSTDDGRNGERFPAES